jgi:hypothetical protein
MYTFENVYIAIYVYIYYICTQTCAPAGPPTGTPAGVKTRVNLHSLLTIVQMLYTRHHSLWFFRELLLTEVVRGWH